MKTFQEWQTEIKRLEDLVESTTEIYIDYGGGENDEELFLNYRKAKANLLLAYQQFNADLQANYPLIHISRYSLRKWRNNAENSRERWKLAQAKQEVMGDDFRSDYEHSLFTALLCGFYEGIMESGLGKNWRNEE